MEDSSRTERPRGAPLSSTTRAGKSQRSYWQCEAITAPALHFAVYAVPHQIPSTALQQTAHRAPLTKPDASKALPELNGKPASARRKPGANLPAPHQAAPCPYPLSSGLNAFAQIARQPFPGSRLVRVPTRSERGQDERSLPPRPARILSSAECVLEFPHHAPDSLRRAKSRPATVPLLLRAPARTLLRHVHSHPPSPPRKSSHPRLYGAAPLQSCSVDCSARPQPR